jgi:hypothetical protein
MDHYRQLEVSYCMGEKHSQLASISFKTWYHLKAHLQPFVPTENETQSAINDVQDMNHPQFRSARTQRSLILVPFLVVGSALSLL